MDLLSKMLSFPRDSVSVNYLSSPKTTNLVSKLTKLRDDLKLRERFERFDSVFADLIAYNRQSNMQSER